MEAQTGIATDPPRLAVCVHERHINRQVRLLLRHLDHLYLGLVAHLDPQGLQGARIERPGLDFLQCGWINPREASHHLEQGKRAETGILAARGPADGGEWIGGVQLHDVHVVTRFRTGRQRKGLVRRDVEQVQAPTGLQVTFNGKEAKGEFGGPVDLHTRFTTGDPSLAEGDIILPLAMAPRVTTSKPAARNWATSPLLARVSLIYNRVSSTAISAQCSSFSIKTARMLQIPR